MQARRHLDEELEKIMELAAPGVTGTERDTLAELFRSTQDLFALTNAELGRTNLVTHRIVPNKDTSSSEISSQNADHQRRSLEHAGERGDPTFQKPLLCPDCLTDKEGREMAVLRGLSEVE